MLKLEGLLRLLVVVENSRSWIRIICRRARFELHAGCEILGGGRPRRHLVSYGRTAAVLGEGSLQLLHRRSPGVDRHIGALLRRGGLVVNEGRGGVLEGQPVARQELIKRWHLGHRRHALATWLLLLLLLQQGLLLLLDLSRQIILTGCVCLIHHVCFDSNFNFV